MARPYTVSSDAVEDHRPQRATRRRRRGRRWLIAVLAVVLLLLAADVGIGWYFSGQILQLDSSAYPATIENVSGSTVTMSRDDSSRRAIPWGLDWPGGHAVLDAHVQIDGDHVQRTVVAVTSGSLAKGLHAALNHDIYDGDPLSTRSMPFTPVDVPGPLGSMPAW